MHLNNGQIRAYLDGEGSRDSRSQVEAHLASCPTCQEHQRRLSQSAQVAAEKLAALAPRGNEAPVSTSAAQVRMRSLIAEKESYMKQKKWVVRYRPALIAATLVLLLGISMAFAPVRAIANSFLGLFRVQQVQVVEVDPGALEELLGNSRQLESFMANDLHVDQVGERKEVGSAAEASSLAGIPVRLPPGMNGEEHLTVTPAAQVNFTVDLDLVLAVLAEIGRTDINLPQKIDGAEVAIELPVMVSASYGDCSLSIAEGYDPDDPKMSSASACTTLVQMSSPEVTAPEGLDMSTLGQAYLQLLGMAPAEAAQFSQNIDWATTLVVPMPAYEATFQEVTVDGVRGTLILGNDQGFEQQYVLVWIKDSIVYVLNGPGSANTALRLADSIR